MLCKRSKYNSFEEFREAVLLKLIEREKGIAPNAIENVNPFEYIDSPIQQIPLDKIENFPASAIVVKQGLKQLSKGGYKMDKGAFHGVRFGRQVDIPIALNKNSDDTYTIIDGFHRAVQVYINGGKSIPAFVKGGSGRTLREIYMS